MVSGAFQSPYDIVTPAGAEGWESMYPSYMIFGPEMRTRDEGKLWFFDQMHNPEPVYPFDLMMPESWLVSLNQYTTRIWNLPTALGIEQRLVNGYLYLSPNVIDDPEMIAEQRSHLPAPGAALLRELGRYLRQMGGKGDRLHRAVECDLVRPPGGT